MQTKKKKKKKVVADNEKHNASAYGGLCKAWQNILQGKIRSLSRSSPGGPANINTHYRLPYFQQDGHRMRLASSHSPKPRLHRRTWVFF